MNVNGLGPIHLSITWQCHTLHLVQNGKKRRERKKKREREREKESERKRARERERSKKKRQKKKYVFINNDPFISQPSFPPRFLSGPLKAVILSSKH